LANPREVKYSKTYAWVKPENNEALVGITDYAQEQLGSILFVEVAKPGDKITQDAPCGTIESDKSTSDVVAPVSGEVVAVNQDAIDAPETINEDPYGKGWLLRVRMSNPSELDHLLSADEFDQFIVSEE